MTYPRRTALFALPAIAAAPFVARAEDSPEPDPVFAARAAWKEAERAYVDAEQRAERAGGEQRVAIPTATGGVRYATCSAGIDRAVSEECRWKRYYTAEWIDGPPKNVAALSDAERAAARGWTMPDTDALKADLAAKRARLAAAMERENVEALDRADREANRAYLATPATTPAGIAAKLRDASDQDDPEIVAALADLDRWTAQDRVGASYSATTPDPACTPMASLHDAHRAAVAAAQAAPDDATAAVKIEEANRIEGAMISAPLDTPEDVAKIVQTIARPWYANEGENHARLAARLDRLAGQGGA